MGGSAPPPPTPFLGRYRPYSVGVPSDGGGEGAKWRSGGGGGERTGKGLGWHVRFPHHLSYAIDSKANASAVFISLPPFFYPLADGFLTEQLKMTWVWIGHRSASYSCGGRGVKNIENTGAKNRSLGGDRDIHPLLHTTPPPEREREKEGGGGSCGKIIPVSLYRISVERKHF